MDGVSRDVMDWDRLAQALLGTLGDHVERQGRPTWVKVLATPEAEAGGAFDVCLSDRAEPFLGWLAPPECQAVGLVATGTAVTATVGAGATDGYPEAGLGPQVAGLGPQVVAGPEAALEPGRGPAGGASSPTQVRVCCLVARHGVIAWAVSGPSRFLPIGPPTAGRLVDRLRGCLCSVPREAPPANHELQRGA